MTGAYHHVNFNVSNLKESLDFYREALGLEEDRRIEAKDGAFIIVYLRDHKGSFLLELTWLKDHPQAYDLGESEFHLALAVDDYEAAFQKHHKMGCVCFVNQEMGVYFINDPDRYWIEIIPEKP